MTYNKYQFIYNSNDLNDKKLLAYAKSINTDFIELDVTAEKLTKSHLAQLCERMEKPFISLVNTNKLKANYSKKADELPFEELAKIVEKEPTLLDTPIFIIGREYNKIKSISDINNLSSFKAADSSEVFQR